MDCERAEELILFEAQERARPDELEALAAHVVTCRPCRESRAHTLWLANGLRVCAGTGADDHLSAQILYEFVRGEPALGEGTRSEIEQHLADCPDCAADLERIRTLGQIDLSPAVRRRRVPARTGWLVAVMAAAAMVSVLWLRPVSDPTFRLLPGEGDGTVGGAHDGSLVLATRFADPDSTALNLDAGPGSEWIAIDLRFVDGLADELALRVLDASGRELWTRPLSRSHLRNGRALLGVRPASLGEGSYRVEVVAREGELVERVGWVRFEVDAAVP